MAEVAAAYGANARAIDLDGDARDEVIAVIRPTSHPARPDLEAIHIHDVSDNIVAQVNFYARVLPPETVDVDGNGTPEIIVPFVRRDSLFATAIDAQGRGLFTILLTHGRPRIEPTGIIPWDPFIAALYAEDTDGDGIRELVSVIAAGYARAPRGVFVHSIPDGRPLGQLLIGAAISRVEMADFDGDGHGEILLECPATNNGASAGGFDDAHAYAIIVALQGGPRIRFRREFGAAIPLRVLVRRGTGSDRPSLVIVSSRLPPSESITEIEVLDPIAGTTTERLARPARFRLVAVGELHARAGDEIALMAIDGELLLLDGRLRELSRTRTDYRGPGVLVRVDDLDGDGMDELVTQAADQWLVLNPEGQTRAVLPPGQYNRFIPGELRRRRTDGASGAHLLVRSGDGTATMAIRLVPNPWHPAYRYGPPVAAALLALGIPSLGIGLGRLRRRNRRLRSVQALALDSAPSGYLLLRRTGRVEWVNGTLLNWLDTDASLVRAQPRYETLLPADSDLTSFCRELLAADETRHRERLARLPIRGREQPVRLVAAPLTPDGGRPDWLLRVVDATEESADIEWRTWALLAQRVAHDLKNPLTSMLLTLQRMRVEYRKQAPAASEALDEYSRRIEDRISHLRRMTANFMKLTRADDPDRRPVHLNEFLESQRATLVAGLPPDIELRIHPSSDARATLLADPEQIASVLENLVANSVNALPDGGAITLTAGTVRGVHLAGQAAADYGLLEVIDTGVGIPQDLLPRIFEPGFSTSRHGSGLGLPIVRKIVSDHGGDVAIESHPGGGTAVSVYLPLLDDTDSRPAVRQEGLRSDDST